MTKIRKTRPRSVDHLRDAVKKQLHQLDPGLRVVAENIMGLASPIDLLTVNDHGEVILMLLALEEESDAALLTLSLAQRAWVAARVGDWARLAPELKLSADATVRAILLAPNFAAETQAAARSLRAGIVQLVRYATVRAGPHSGLLLESVGPSRPSHPEQPHSPNAFPAQAFPAQAFPAQAFPAQASPAQASPAQEPSPPLPDFRSNLSDSDLGLRPAVEESLGE